MHGDTVVTKNQEGGKKPLNKDESKEPPFKMNRGVNCFYIGAASSSQSMRNYQQPPGAKDNVKNT